MMDIALLILPIFVLIGIGYAALRGGLMTGAQNAGLAAFVLNFALPAVIVLGFARPDLMAEFNIGYVLAYGAGSLVAFGATFAILKLALRRPLALASIGAMGGSASNSGFIGYPVAALVIGPTAMIALPFTMLVENLLVIPLALALAEFGTSKEASLGRVLRQTVARLSRMPILIAVAVGSMIALSGVSLPGPAVSTLELLAAASAPCALVAVGGIIAELKPGDVSGDALWIVAGKLVLHPLAVTGFMLAIPGIPAELMAAGILFSCVSMITIYPLLAARYGQEKMAAAALVVATVIGLGTLVAVISVLLGGPLAPPG
jgi:malonate transporter and related proteins